MESPEACLHPHRRRRLHLPPLRMFFDPLRQTDPEINHPWPILWVALSPSIRTLRPHVGRDIVKGLVAKPGIPTRKQSGELYFRSSWDERRPRSIKQTNKSSLVRRQEDKKSRKQSEPSDLVISHTQQLVCLSGHHVFRLAFWPIMVISQHGLP